ncbi:MAG: 4Fe-4S binding protein [Spirochaetes bacterium]|nr:4Fe-4S binding protein [Spirochaetota bacterium]
MDTYEQLRDLLDSHPSTAPESKAILDILKILFAPDEAALALVMSFKPWSLEKIAAAAALSVEEARTMLEGMAGKGVVFSKTKGDDIHYGLLPLIPGVFEFPFMRSDGSPMYRELGALWETYHAEALGASFSGNPTPLMRVVAVDRSLKPEHRVHPYEEVRHFIENAKSIALADCACRTSVGACDRPKDVCLIFDSAADFLISRGFARSIDVKEGMEVLDRAERAGLVHTSNNSSDRANLICNCCPCCCTVLRGRTQLRHPHAFEPSRFEAAVTSDECTGCGLCAEDRCPVKAIAMKEGVAVVDTAECIGCGLCVTACPAEAIDLVERKSVPKIPATITEMGITVAKEKGRLERFVRVMQR